MNCCVECFHDKQLQTMISANGVIGNCDFCGSKNVRICSVDTQSDISDLISEAISVYEESDTGEPLSQALLNDWGIFDRTKSSSVDLIASFCNTIFGDKNFLNRLVHIPTEYYERYGIFSGHTWKEFSDVIKEKNRFFNGFFKPDQFATFLSYSVNRYPKGEMFCRARICDNPSGYKATEMYSPPFGKRKPGRVNPEGVGVLYLTSDEKTAISEVRAGSFDYLTIGSFRLKKEIKVVDISGLNDISPALYSSGLETLAVNTRIFSDIAKEIAKPLRRTDSPLEYLPTQYITEFIKSKGYSGVSYKSTMGTGGYNIAAFDETLFECVGVHVVEIKNISYCFDNVP